MSYIMIRFVELQPSIYVLLQTTIFLRIVSQFWDRAEAQYEIWLFRVTLCGERYY